MPQLSELTEAECRRLLASDEIGRVGLTAPEGPIVVPVSYVLDGDMLVFATAPYTSLGRHARDARLAVEVDQLDYQSGHGWSVLVTGTAEVAEPEELTVLPRPWADGTRPLLIRVPLERISGRRLGWGWQPTAPGPDERRLGPHRL